MEDDDNHNQPSRRPRRFNPDIPEFNEGDYIGSTKLPPFNEHTTALVAPPSNESTKGTFFPVTDYSKWRVRARNDQAIKLDDAAKERYLVSMAKWGKRGMAAAAAGVSCSCINKHMTEDPEFKVMADVAYDEYREQRVLKIENEALMGFEETIFSPTGERATRLKYETSLRMMILKAYDRERYGDKVELEHSFKGGAVVVPMTPTPDDWEAQFNKQQSEYQIPETIDTVGYTFADKIADGSIIKNTEKDKI